MLTRLDKLPTACGAVSLRARRGNSKATVDLALAYWAPLGERAGGT
jgi:hypothetical protein